jgi:hypothetical protein
MKTDVHTLTYTRTWTPRAQFQGFFLVLAEHVPRCFRSFARERGALRILCHLAVGSNTTIWFRARRPRLFFADQSFMHPQNLSKLLHGCTCMSFFLVEDVSSALAPHLMHEPVYKM